MKIFPGARFIRGGARIERTFYPTDPHVMALVSNAFTPQQVVYTINTSATEPLAPDELAIKDYSECEGVYIALLQAGVIHPAHRYIRQGFVEKVPVVRLACALDELPEART